MKESGDFVEEPKDVAQLLNKYFRDVGKNMAKAIPPIHSTYKPPPSTYSKNSLFMSLMTPEEIANVITSVINKKALGLLSENIDNYFIEISSVIFLFYLFHLYFYPPDLQKSDGGANTQGKQLPRPALEMPRYCCPLVI